MVCTFIFICDILFLKSSVSVWDRAKVGILFDVLRWNRESSHHPTYLYFCNTRKPFKYCCLGIRTIFVFPVLSSLVILSSNRTNLDWSFLILGWMEQFIQMGAILLAPFFGSSWEPLDVDSDLYKNEDIICVSKYLLFLKFTLQVFF